MAFTSVYLTEVKVLILEYFMLNISIKFASLEKTSHYLLGHLSWQRMTITSKVHDQEGGTVTD